jgi:hypothetical protein
VVGVGGSCALKNKNEIANAINPMVVDFMQNAPVVQISIPNSNGGFAVTLHPPRASIKL